MAATLATTIVRGAVIQGSEVWNPASIANGAKEVFSMTSVTGAAVGDFVMASFSNALQGMSLTAEVSATNTVAATLMNNTGGALDLASGTLTVRVEKK